MAIWRLLPPALWAVSVAAECDGRGLNEKCLRAFSPEKIKGQSAELVGEAWGEHGSLDFQFLRRIGLYNKAQSLEGLFGT